MKNTTHRKCASKPAHTLYTYSSWLSSDSVVPSSLIRGVKANPNSFFSPLSLAERKHIIINTHHHAASTQRKPYLYNSTRDPIHSNKETDDCHWAALLTHWSSVWTQSVGGTPWNDLWELVAWPSRSSEGRCCGTGRKSDTRWCWAPRCPNWCSPEENKRAQIRLLLVTYIHSVTYQL